MAQPWQSTPDSITDQNILRQHRISLHYIYMLVLFMSWLRVLRVTKEIRLIEQKRNKFEFFKNYVQSDMERKSLKYVLQL